MSLPSWIKSVRFAPRPAFLRPQFATDFAVRENSPHGHRQRVLGNVLAVISGHLRRSGNDLDDGLVQKSLLGYQPPAPESLMPTDPIPVLVGLT